MSELPAGWRYSPLSEVVELQRGFDLPSHSRRPGPYPVLTSGEGGGSHDEAPVAGPGFVVGRATNIGRPKWSSGDYWPHNTTMFAKDFKGNSPRWLYHLFEATDLSGFDSGSVQPMLNRNYVAQVQVAVPPLSEQVAIAEVLAALDDKIAANTAMAGTVDRFLASTFERLVEGHDVQNLTSVADVNRTSVRPSAGSLRYLDITSVGIGEYTYPELIDWAQAPGRARRGVATGDTVWSTVRPNRRSHALILDATPELVASTGLAVLSPRDVGPAYLYEATRRPEFSAYLENVAEGSAYPAVRAERFLEAPIPDVPAESRNAFETLAAPLRHLLASNARENRTLAATRDALLPQLMSGKLRVRDAEAIAADAGA